mgnify:CR=1 FL=1
MNYQGLMEITKIENIADDVYEMTLKGEGAKYISQPGQFINIKINETNVYFWLWWKYNCDCF